jgi:heptaprenyl diphosphate synthase/octaprenyl-diphosphate synthase
VITIAGKHLLAEGGVRLRAALTLLSAQLGTYRLERTLNAAAAAELLHTAALMHNDMVDEADRRRGLPAAAERWDHGISLMVGDYFFALSAGEMALTSDRRIMAYFAQAVMETCEGELAPVMSATPLETAREQYYYRIGARTAALFRAACKAGMVSGDGSDAQIEAMGEFGYHLGLAVQISEDIRDYGTSGKRDTSAGHDLRRGVITLPLMYAVAEGGGERLAAVVDTHDAAQVAWAIDEVRRLGVAPARADLHRLVAQAQQQLDFFPDQPARRVLADICATVAASTDGV